MGNPVVQWQILATQPEKAEQFYTALFGWTVNDNNALRYRRLETGAGRGIDGGIWPAPQAAQSMVQLFVEVDDLARYVERSEALGARVVIPPQHLPDGDEMAVILDPLGVAVALVRPTAR